MTRVLTMSVLAAMMALGLSGAAEARDHHPRCDFVKKCHGHSIFKRCETVKVCHDQGFDRHDWKTEHWRHR